MILSSPRGEAVSSFPLGELAEIAVILFSPRGEARIAVNARFRPFLKTCNRLQAVRAVGARLGRRGYLAGSLPERVAGVMLLDPAAACVPDHELPAEMSHCYESHKQQQRLPLSPCPPVVSIVRRDC